MPILTPPSEATETATPLSEVVGQDGLYPKATTFPSATTYPKPRIAPTLTPLEEV